MLIYRINVVTFSFILGFQIVYSKLTDLLPSAITSEDDPELQRPSSDEVQDITNKTRQALEKLTQVSAEFIIKILLVHFLFFFICIYYI